MENQRRGNLTVATMTAVADTGIRDLDLQRVFKCTPIPRRNHAQQPPPPLRLAYLEYCTSRVKVCRGVYPPSRSGKPKVSSVSAQPFLTQQHQQHQEQGATCNAAGNSSCCSDSNNYNNNNNHNHNIRPHTNGFRNLLSVLVVIRQRQQPPSAADGTDDTDDTDEYHVNVKVFRNGKLQMTGVRTESDGRAVAVYVRTLVVVGGGGGDCEHDHDSCGGMKAMLDSFRICMINSTFSVSFAINRARLQTLLLRMNFQCMFDPDIYHAVKIRRKYGKRFVTVAVFQTGSVIITGAVSMEEVFGVYDIFHELLIGSKQEIQRIEWRIVE